MLAPISRLRAEYADAIPNIERLVVELERMRLALSAVGSPPPPTAATSSPAQAPTSDARLDVRGDFARVLELQNQLTRIPGVANVRVTHLSGEGATLVVELASPAPD